LPDITERSTTLPSRERPWSPQHLAEVVGDRWAALGAGLALGAPDQETGSDLVVLEHAGPLEAVDLGAAQAGVERDRVRETVLRLECGEQRRSLGRQGNAQARLLVVGRQLD
jgi:hypothetical protein